MKRQRAYVPDEEHGACRRQRMDENREKTGNIEEILAIEKEDIPNWEERMQMGDEYDNFSADELYRESSQEIVAKGDIRNTKGEQKEDIEKEDIRNSKGEQKEDVERDYDNLSEDSDRERMQRMDEKGHETDEYNNLSEDSDRKRMQRMDENGDETGETEGETEGEQEMADEDDNLSEDSDRECKQRMDENGDETGETEGEQEMADEDDEDDDDCNYFRPKFKSKAEEERFRRAMCDVREETYGTEEVEQDKILERRFYNRSSVCGVLEDFGEDILKPFKEGKNRVVIEEVPSALDTCTGLARIAPTYRYEQIAVNWSEVSRTLTIGPIADTEHMEYVKELLGLAGSGNSDLIRKKMIKYCLRILQNLTWPDGMPLLNEAQLECTLLEVAARGNLRKGSRESKVASYERGVQTVAAWSLGDVNVSFIDDCHCHGNEELLKDFRAWSIQVLTAFDPPLCYELNKLDFDTEDLYMDSVPMAYLHVEMAVVEGIVRRGDKSLQCLGTSQPCCYQCYQVIRILNEHHGYNIRIKDCGMELNGFWKIPDLPPDIKTDVLHRLHHALSRAVSDALQISTA